MRHAFVYLDSGLCSRLAMFLSQPSARMHVSTALAQLPTNVIAIRVGLEPAVTKPSARRHAAAANARLLTHARVHPDGQDHFAQPVCKQLY